jgi:hypothetical protein
MIQLDVGPVLCLGELEVDDHNRGQTGRGVDPADLAAEISLVGIEHVRDDDVPDGGKEVVESEANGLRFWHGDACPRLRRRCWWRDRRLGRTSTMSIAGRCRQSCSTQVRMRQSRVGMLRLS